MYLSITQKIVFARIITDLIEADFIVDEDEMKFLGHLISKDCVGLSTTILSKQKNGFCKDCYDISGDIRGNKHEILRILKQLTRSDGICLPLKAIQEFSVGQVFLHKAVLYSVS